jgi:tRNA(fMet)-specific endonuclease VapC
MLDTNTISMVSRATSPMLDLRLSRVVDEQVCLSVVTEGEVLFGLAKSPDATRKAALMHAMLVKFAILPWTSKTAAIYGTLRADMRRAGRALGALDMMIAAHSLEMGTTLVTADAAFQHVPGLTIENWTI